MVPPIGSIWDLHRQTLTTQRAFLRKGHPNFLPLRLICLKSIRRRRLAQFQTLIFRPLKDTNSTNRTRERLPPEPVYLRLHATLLSGRKQAHFSGIFSRIDIGLAVPPRNLPQFLGFPKINQPCRAKSLSCSANLMKKGTQG